MPKSLTVFAPAKINLFLHVAGRRDDGYHLLDSLVAFADIGDEIAISPAGEFIFNVSGPFAGRFTAKETDSSPSSANLAVRAAWLLARRMKKRLDVRISLTKNLPLAAGIGGGSADAAAVLWGLLEWWKLPKDPEIARELMADLGADLPACFACRPARMQGVGESLAPLPLPEVPVVLANPQRPCPTRDVFLRHIAPYTENMLDIPACATGQELTAFLKRARNDLLEAACETVPEIHNVLSALKAEPGCGLARLSGSGATCFGLFSDTESASRAAVSIRCQNPDWWVEHGMLNRPERY